MRQFMFIACLIHLFTASTALGQSVNEEVSDEVKAITQERCQLRKEIKAAKKLAETWKELNMWIIALNEGEKVTLVERMAFRASLQEVLSVTPQYYGRDFWESPAPFNGMEQLRESATRPARDLDPKATQKDVYDVLWGKVRYMEHLQILLSLQNNSLKNQHPTVTYVDVDVACKEPGRMLRPPK